MEKTKRLIEEKGYSNLAMSRFDSIACVISKAEGLQVLELEHEVLQDLKTCFKEVIKWSKNIKQVVNKRFEIIGLPIHIMNEYTIRKIGSCIGEVTAIHNQKQYSDTAEVSINLNDKRECQKSINVKKAQGPIQYGFIW